MEMSVSPTSQCSTEEKDSSCDDSEKRYPSDSEDDVGVEFTANITRMSSILVQQGVQVFNGFFFGSSRAGL